MGLTTRLLSGATIFGGIVSSSGPIAPNAVNDNPEDLEVDTGNYDIDVLANDIYSGTPTISIQSQSGPGTATIVGTGTASRIRVPTDGLSDGTKVVTYELSATGNTGSDTADLTVNLIPPPPATGWTDSVLLNGGQTSATVHNFTVQVPSGADRVALVALGLDVVSATSVVLDPAGANIFLTNVRDWQKPPSRVSFWRLFEAEMPAAGSYTLRITLNASNRVIGQWQSAVGVAQAVYAVGNWETNKTSIALRADRIYASGSLAYAAIMDSSQLSNWTVSLLFKKLELQNQSGGDTFVTARATLTAAGAPEPIFSNTNSAGRLVGFQAFLQPVGSSAPSLRTISRPATSDWTDHGTQIARVAGTWEDGIATSTGLNGLTVVEWRGEIYCLYGGYSGNVGDPDNQAEHRAIGYATSPDGVTWTKYGSNPVITHWGSGTNHQEEGVWGFTAAINPNNGELNVVWGALQATSSSSVRSDLSLTIANGA